MYTMANTTVSILRGTDVGAYGDEDNSGTVIQSGIPAFLTSPGPSSFKPVILGTTIFPPGTEMPSITRDITCVLPAYTDVTVDDQVLDEMSQVKYQVYLVTQQGPLGGLIPDLQLTLRRVTTNQPV